MSKSDSINPEISRLRQSLKQLDAWPDAGDQLLALLPHSSWHAPFPEADDYQLVPDVVRQAVSGSDIGARYPAFFQKLLAHTGLRQDFLAELSRTANGKLSS